MHDRLEDFLKETASLCAVRSEYPYNDPEQMARCLAETAGKLRAVVAMLSDEDRGRIVPASTAASLTTMGPFMADLNAQPALEAAE